MTPMNPIRFQCQSCSQPLEVDEEWAEKTVACPYCKATVTAPAESTLTNLEQIHTASPATSSPTGSAYAVHHHAYAMVPARNTLAVVAFSLSLLLIGLFIAAAIIVAPHQLEMESFQEMLQSSEANGKSQMQILNDFTEQYGGAIPGWLIAIVMIEAVSILIFLAAVVCGILGVRRTPRKHLAVISLAICSGMFFFFIAGLMLSM